MDDIIHRLEAAIAQKRAELRRLRVALGVLRDLPADDSDPGTLADQVPGETGLGNGSNGNLVGLTIAQAAERILAGEDGKAMHFRKIVEAAASHGYRSPKEGSSSHANAQSFYTIMKRHPERFVLLGGGRFCLKPSGSLDPFTVKEALAAEPVRSLKGEGHPMRKLTEDQVREIRSRSAGGIPQKELAAAYGVHVPCISMIVNRKSWKHVD